MVRRGIRKLPELLDYRLVLVGSMLPDIIDKPLGGLVFREALESGRTYCHTVPSDIKHEQYSVAIIKKYFSSIIKEHFPDIKVEEIVSLLTKGYIATELLFLGGIIDGEIDADKLDYLLRDSYYCGVSYGKYDLGRILDTITVIPVMENEVGDKDINKSGEPGGYYPVSIF